MRDFWMHTYDLLLRGGAAAAGFLYGMAQKEGRPAILLAALMAADYLSGVVAAALGKSSKSAHGKLSSDAGAKGLLKKAVILLVVGLAYVTDWFVNQGNAMFLTAVLWFYISNEALSLLENLARCGVPVPKRLRAMLEKLAAEQEEESAPSLHTDSAAPSASPPVQDREGQNG